MSHDVLMVLAVAEERLAEINAFLQRQRAIIDNLSAAGSDTTAATTTQARQVSKQAAYHMK